MVAEKDTANVAVTRCYSHILPPWLGLGVIWAATAWNGLHSMGCRIQRIGHISNYTLGIAVVKKIPGCNQALANIAAHQQQLGMFYCKVLAITAMTVVLVPPPPPPPCTNGL